MSESKIQIQKFTIDQLRDELADASANNIDIFSLDFKEIFLYGVHPIVKYTNEELVDAWLNAVDHTDLEVNDELLEELQSQSIDVLVAQVTDNDGVVLFDIFQEDSYSFSFKQVLEGDTTDQP